MFCALYYSADKSTNSILLLTQHVILPKWKILQNEIYKMKHQYGFKACFKPSRNRIERATHAPSQALLSPADDCFEIEAKNQTTLITQPHTDSRQSVTDLPFPRLWKVCRPKDTRDIAPVNRNVTLKIVSFRALFLLAHVGKMHSFRNGNGQGYLGMVLGNVKRKDRNAQCLEWCH